MKEYIALAGIGPWQPQDESFPELTLVAGDKFYPEKVGLTPEGIKPMVARGAIISVEDAKKLETVSEEETDGQARI